MLSLRFPVIPKELEGVTVKGIGADAFKNNKELKGIEIPETVSYIEWGAFEGCDNLTDINIPQNVMKIEDMTFADCTSAATNIFFFIFDTPFHSFPVHFISLLYAV